jgi:D-alanyl-D-alanine carboxypeptidase
MKKWIILTLFLLLLVFLPKSEVYAIEDVTAQSAVLMDSRTGRVLYGKNINERHLTASIAKIMTAVTAIEHLDLDKEITVTPDVLRATGSSIYLEVGDKVRIIDLLYGLMLRSGNDAALMISLAYSGNEQDFIRLMNDEAKKIKMLNSTFENPSGLDETTKNYSTAYDMALLMRYALRLPAFRMITSTRRYTATTSSGKILDFYNKHRLVTEYPLATGGKTGYTKKAGRTLVTSFQNRGMEVVVVTFEASGDWEIHKNLAEYAFQNFTYQKIISRAHFKMSTCLYSLKYYIEDDIYFPLKEDDVVAFGLYLRKVKKRYRGEIGYLNIYVNQELVCRVPVYQ